MQHKRQWSDDAAWLVLIPATRFLPPPAPANDALPARSEPAGLLGAIRRAASWLLAEAIFGYAVYGAAAHPGVLDPVEPRGRGGVAR